MKFLISIMLTCVLVCGCARTKEEREARIMQQLEFIYVEQDGHQWVVLYGSQKAGLVHHPDCPCFD
jgi:hypothetical protein